MTPYYEQDGIVIYHGDCRDMLSLVDGGVMVTDPPYGIKYASGSMGVAWWQGKQIGGDRDTSLRDEVLERWGKPALVFGSWKAPKPKGTRMVLVWDKGPALGMGALDLPWKPSWDEIYVLGRGFQGHRGGGVLSFSPVQAKSSNGRIHPNEKPVALLRELLAKCPHGPVIDPFMGSGSTLQAAKDLGRAAVGIEIEERYCEAAAKRLQQSVMTLELAAD